jgi:cytochrome P450 family 135
VPPRAALPAGPRLPRAWQFARYQLAPIELAEACAARYGDVFTLRLLGFGPVVVATEPADVRTILTSAPGRFAGETARRVFEPIMGPSALMFASGATHARQRRALKPAFQRELAQRWRGRLEGIVEAELARLPTGEPLALREPMRRIALEAVCQLVVGLAPSARNRPLREALARGLGPEVALLSCFPTLWRRDGRLNPGRPLKRRRDLIHRALLAQIAARRADPRGGGDDALSLLLAAGEQTGEPLSDAELRDQLVGLLLAGHDTTAAALTWAVERASRNPHAQARMAEEVAGGGTEYLDAAIRETLRTRPAVADVLRTTAREIELGGHRIPAGTMVSAMVAATHRRRDLWERPREFRPERFLGERPAPYAFAPFGGGLRRCVGTGLALLQLQVVLAATVRRFVVLPVPGREEPARLAGLALVPARGGRVVLQPRA